jgi:hypothetical protein
MKKVNVASVVDSVESRTWRKAAARNPAARIPWVGEKARRPRRYRHATVAVPKPTLRSRPK